MYAGLVIFNLSICIHLKILNYTQWEKENENEIPIDVSFYLACAQFFFNVHHKAFVIPI